MSIQRQHLMMDRIERPFIRDVMREKNRFIEQQSKILYNTRRVNDNDALQHRQNMYNIFQKYYRRTIVEFFNYTESTISKTMVFDLETKFSAWEFFLLEWITARGGAAARQTSETTVSDINHALREALDTTEAITETALVTRILRTKLFSRFRAVTIARTETHGTAMYASRRTAEKLSNDLGIMLYKKWNAVEDERTRFSHSAVDGKKIPQNDFFIVNGARMDRPGDPRGGAGNVINCRCVLTYERVGA